MQSIHTTKYNKKWNKKQKQKQRQKQKQEQKQEQKQKAKQRYQIEKRSETPTASTIVTFLRRPPIKRCTDEIIINVSDGRFAINGDGAFEWVNENEGEAR